MVLVTLKVNKTFRCHSDVKSHLWLFCALIKLHHGFLLLVSFDGAASQSADLLDGVDAGQFVHLHQVAGQHGAGPAMAVHAVHCHALRRRRNTACKYHPTLDQSAGRLILHITQLTYQVNFSISSENVLCPKLSES